MGENNDSPAQTNSDSTPQDVYMPSMAPLSIVEAVGSKLFGRRGPIKPASRTD